MASLLMNAIKEEAAASATSVASVASTVLPATRSTVAHSIASCAPSARAAVGVESTTLLTGVGRGQALQAIRTQPVLGNLSTTVGENSIMSSVLSNSTTSESATLRNVFPELRQQVSNAAQQGFEEAIGDKMPQLQPPAGLAETVKQFEEVTAR